MTHTGSNQVLYLYLENQNCVTHNEDGGFSIAYPFKSFASLTYGHDENDYAVSFIQFNTSPMMFNQLAAINKMKELGISLVVPNV